MFEITKKIRERFCKDCAIPIKIFEEPYFTQRIELLDTLYGSISKWKMFLTCIEKYDSENAYFEDCSRVYNAMIEYIKQSDGFVRFNTCDMNQYCNVEKAYKLVGHTSSDIFRPSNIGKNFISLDIKKANFTALKHFGDVFNDFATYEDFARNFTDNQFFIESKYIREVIFGNCNPRRQTTYERYLVDKFLNFLFENEESLVIGDKCFSDIVCYVSNDEIVLDCDKSSVNYNTVVQLVKNFELSEGVTFKPECFQLAQISGDISGYVKSVSVPETKIELKCCSSLNVPFVARFFNNTEITEDDLVFVYEGKLAKYLSLPQFKIENLLSQQQ